MRYRTENAMQRAFQATVMNAVAVALWVVLAICPLRNAQAQEASTGAKTARVAVFGEPGFPSYLADDKAMLPPPDAIVARLESLGIPAEVVHADALADGSRFNAGRYSLLVLPYGNCYPQIALQNLQTFHREGGGFVLTGIPFSHAVVLDRGAIEGWDVFPQWGELARVAPGAGRHGQNALRLHGRADDSVWAGSAHFPVRPQEKIRVSAWFKDQEDQPSGESYFFLRFWDTDGHYIGQDGVMITYSPDWQPFVATVTVPEKAAAADVTPQIWHDPRRAFLMSEPAVFASGRAISTVPLQNGTFARAGDRWRDQGDLGKDAALFGPNGVGVGSYSGSDDNAKPYLPAPGDPLGIAPMGYVWSPANRVQTLDPASLPKTDTIIPLVGTHDHPVAALIVHHSDDYRGVVDAWVYKGPGGETDIGGTGQMIVRGVAAALEKQGHLSDARVKACYAALDRLVSGKSGKKAGGSAGKTPP